MVEIVEASVVYCSSALNVTNLTQGATVSGIGASVYLYVEIKGKQFAGND